MQPSRQIPDWANPVFFPVTELQSKRFQCPVCYRTLSSKQNFREHTYIHTGEKPFACKERGCPERFRQGSQLSVHMKMHRAVRTLCHGSGEIIIPKVGITQLTDLMQKNSGVFGKTGSGETYDISEEERKRLVLPPLLLKEGEAVAQVSQAFYVE